MLNKHHLSNVTLFPFLVDSLKVIGIIYVTFGIFACTNDLVSAVLGTQSLGFTSFIVFTLCILLIYFWIVRSQFKWHIPIRIFPAKFENISFIHFFLLGLVVRLIVILSTDTAIISDGKSYLEHSKNLAFNGYYGFDNSQPGAFWPPGYPLFLYPFVLIFDAGNAAIIASNIFIYSLASWGLWLTSQLLFSRSTSNLALLIFVLWPQYVFLVNVAAKESVILLLLTWTAYFLFVYLQKGRAFGLVIIGGMSIGMMILCQPSSAVIGIALLISLVLVQQKIIKPLAIFLLTLLISVSTVSFWTYRNYQLYQKVIPVSLNGGDVFYRANNPRAEPGYNAPSPRDDISDLDPVSKNTIGFELGITWIKENPLNFLDLAFRKGLVYLANDDTSIWQIYENERSSTAKSISYIIFKVISSLFWLVSLIALLVFTYLRHGRLNNLEIFATLCFLGLLSVDLLFEAGSRHHIPQHGLMYLMIAHRLIEKTKVPNNFKKSVDFL